MSRDTNVLGNVYDKYNTRNPVSRLLFRSFLKSFHELLRSVSVSSLLEVGCGEGNLSQLIAGWFEEEISICSVDLSGDLFDPGIVSQPRISFSAQSVYQLAFPRDSFDMVVAAEVLEHLANPKHALSEIRRVARSFVLLSVPREPIWRVMNLARFAYWRELGNTPGHIQHWSVSHFLSLVSRNFEIVQVRKPLPWIIVLAVKKGLGS
jgi:ubiquinone/menaquinone biosynthesis C-methylase UbiE